VVVLASLCGALPAHAGSVATTWTCTTNNWGQTACWSTLNGGDAYPDNGAATYAVTLPDGGSNYLLTMAPAGDPAVTIDSLDMQNTPGTGKATLSISSGKTLTILDSLTLRGQITSSGTFTVAPTAAINIDQGELLVQGGGSATVPVTSYTSASGCGGHSLRATGAGSFLDLSSLTNVIQPGCSALTIRADAGAEVDVSSLAIGALNSSFQADGAGSILHLDSMTTLIDEIRVLNGGTLIAGPIDTLDGAVLLVSGPTSVFDESQISSATASNIHALAGATLALPLLTAYSGSDLNGLQARGASSLLDLPNLASVESTHLSIILEADIGGTVNLPALTSTIGAIQFRCSGAGSVLNIPLIDTLTPGVLLDVRDGGQVNAAPITSAAGATILVINATSVLDLSQVTNADQSVIRAEGGANVELPLLASYTGLGGTFLRAQDAGSVLSFPAMTTLSGGPSSGVLLHASFGGTVLLPALDSMTDVVHVQTSNSANSLIVLGMANFEAGSLGITGGGTVRVLGDFSFELTNESNWIWSGGSTLEMTGQCSGSSPVSMEIGGSDLGVNEAGYTANFHLDRLRIGSGALVQLVDAKDNGNRNGVGGAAEALYVDTIQFADAAGVLYTNGLQLYYHTLIGDPAQIILGSAPTGVCDDGNACTSDSCVGGACTHVDECAAAAALYEPGSWSCPPAAPGGCGVLPAGESECLLRGVYLHSGEFTEAAVDLYIPGRAGSFVTDISSGLLRPSGRGNSFVDEIMQGLLRDTGRGNSFTQGILSGMDLRPSGGNSFTEDIMSGMLRDAGRGNSFTTDIMSDLLRPSGRGNSFVEDIMGDILRPRPVPSVASNAKVLNLAMLATLPFLRDTGRGNSFVEDIMSGLLRDTGPGNQFIADGPDSIFARKYRSRVGPTTAMGNGWDFSYNIYIEAAGADRVVHDGWTRADVYEEEATQARRHEGTESRSHEGETSKTRNVETSKQDGHGGAISTATSQPEGLNESSRGQAQHRPRNSTHHDDFDPEGVAYSDARIDPSGWTTLTGSNGDDADATGGVAPGYSRVAFQAADGEPAARGGNPTWTKREFFRKLEQNPDGTYTLYFAGRGKWNFHPLDSGPSEVRGKISSIVDRTGNSMTFTYDGSGRLTTITDALGRDVTITYHAGPLSDYIESIFDFTGRSVTYAHYDGVEAGGNFGDLKSVTSPAMTGTPTGNDFPSGKTVTYKYTTGNADENLNHNLTEIIDAKGQTIVYNGHAGTTNPADPDYDHVVSQQWGSAGQTSQVTYAAQTPSAGNGFATVKAIVNDRVGNVSEHFYDAGNRLVRLHEYTGRATPGMPTTDVANRPASPLRPGEPAYFETQFEWNVDSLPTRTVYPNDNEVTRAFDTNHVDPLHRGDMTQRCALAGPLGGDQAQICESFEYNTAFGGAYYNICEAYIDVKLLFGANGGAGFYGRTIELIAPRGPRFVTKYTDPRGHDTLMAYGAEGNLTQITHAIPTIVEEFRYNPFGQLTRHIHPDNGSGHRRVDKFVYYGPGDGIQNGYLKNVVIDALHDDQNDPPGTGSEFQLTTTFEYNAAGMATKVTDPKGGDIQLVRNSLNQVVRALSREVTLGGGVRYERDFYYDANNNVVRVDVQNKNEAGVLQANTHFTTVIEREILNRPTKVCRESGSYTGAIPGTVNLPVCTGLPDAEFAPFEYGYDANRNVTLMRSGEAAEGRQPNNTVGLSYDERDLVFLVVRAPGDTAQSTAQLDYDGNGNTKRVKGGLEDAPGVRTSDFTYDGFNRLMSATDPMGNVSEYHYDPNGNPGGFANAAETTANPFAVRVSGQLIDVDGSAGNARLAQVMWEWDEENRPTRREVAFFNPANQTDIGDGESVTTFVWSDSSQIESVTDDNLNVTAYSYDTAQRLKVVTDAKTNTMTYGYDANSNVTSVTSLEKSDLGQPPAGQSFTTTYAYDALDRRITSADNVGNTHQYAYDSRGNLISILLPSLRETRHEYDGLNRRTQTCRDMGGNGANCIIDVDDIVNFQSWDDSSRRISRTDDNGNATRYAYDALNRRIVTQMADGTIDQVGTGATWVLGNDAPNLGGFVSGYDVHDNAGAQTDANGTVIESQFDRNDRLTDRAITPGAGVSNDTLSETYEYDGAGRIVSAIDDDATVTVGYDSMSNVIQDGQNGESVISNWDGWNNYLTVTYPGGRVITHTYDALNRISTVADAGGTIATYDYIGPDRVERRTYNANDTAVDYSYDGISNLPGDFGVKRIVRTKHFKLTGGAIVDERTYTWDRVYNKTQRKDVRAGGPGLTHDYEYDDALRLIDTTVTDAALVVERQTTYALDGVGNRLNMSGAPDPGNYVMDTTLPEPADFQTNQYTSTPFDDREYDDNGNLTLIQPGAGTLIAPLTGDNTCQTSNADLGTPCNVPGDCTVAGSTCGLKNRYISITPANGGTATSIKVRVITSPQFPAAVGTEYYAGPEQSIPNSPNPALRGAPLQCTATPHSQVWTTGVLHLFGPGIVPSTLNPTTYGVSHCDSTGRNCSAELVVQMAKWADVVRPFGGGAQPNFGDINAIVQKFSNQATAPSMPRADLVGPQAPGTPNTPNQIANFSDVSNAVSAFGGFPYPYAGPPSCAGIDPLGPSLIIYDYCNQMVRYVDPLGIETQYRYDALGRRMMKTVDALGTPETTRFFYNDWRVVEEQDGMGAIQTTYVYGNGIDEVLNMRRMGVDYYYHADDLGNLMAVTNAAGSIAERYDYYDFGGPVFLDASGNPTGGTESTIGNPYLFTGREYDAETGLYYYRTRYLDPAAGRFATRDRIGIWGDASNLGNGLTYVANNPFTLIDPLGLDPLGLDATIILEEQDVEGQSNENEGGVTRMTSPPRLAPFWLPREGDSALDRRLKRLAKDMYDPEGDPTEDHTPRFSFGGEGGICN